MIFEEKTRSIPITKEMIWEAYKKVKSNGGSAGIDEESIATFDQVRSKELYKIWNRLSSGSYFAPLIKRVTIPKGNGKTRPLGIPTVRDRIAQQVVKTYLEPRLDVIFIANSYGYRPNKDAHSAIKVVQENLRNRSWVIDLDIKEFFENVNHELLLKALKKHVSEKWVLMYIQRWLEASILMEDGSLKTCNGKGTPQGGVISPLLANLYLHYCVDKWLEIHYPTVKLVRYADDMVIHCMSYQESQTVLASLKERLKTCGLTAHEEKTKIVYCGKYEQKGHFRQFDFLGFSFQPMSRKSKNGELYLYFGCKMSRKSKIRIKQNLRAEHFQKKSQLTIQDLATKLNPMIRGWINYYGKISKWSLNPVFYHLHHQILRWILKKYKRFKGSKVKAIAWLRKIGKSYSMLFYHWELGYRFF